MKILFVSEDKTFIQKIKEDFFDLQKNEKIVFVVKQNIVNGSIENEDIQCVWIDIDYVLNPIELASKIHNEHPYIDIVFMGSTCESVYTLYEVEHIGYIYKLDANKYIKCIGERIMTRENERNKRFIKVHWKNAIYVIDSFDILYIERDKRKTLIHTQCGEIYMTYQHIDEFAGGGQTGFMRTHFSYYVNTLYVKEFHRNHLILSNDAFIPISRKYAKEIKEYYESPNEF